MNTGHVTDAGNLQVLMYHHVSNKTGLVTLSPRTFRAQMKWLAESGGKTADVFLSRERMKEMLGYCSLHLCWSEGYYNHGYIEVAKELGFSYLYTTERRMNSSASGSLRIGRISTKERENVGWLKRRLFYYTTPGFSSLLALHKGPRLTAD